MRKYVFWLLVITVVLIVLYYQAKLKSLAKENARLIQGNLDLEQKLNESENKKLPSSNQKQISLEQFASNAYAGDFVISGYSLNTLLAYDNRISKLKSHLISKGVRFKAILIE